MSVEISQLDIEWNRSKPKASGQTVVNIYGAAAMQTWEGAEALIDAYTELENDTGEDPNRSYINDALYFKLKEYWNSNRTTKELNKLDEFISKLN
jgi:hypothetical protein